MNEFGEIGINDDVLTMTSDSKGEIIYTFVLRSNQLNEINQKREIDIYDPNFTQEVPFVGTLYKGDQIVGKGQASVVYHSDVDGDSELTYNTSYALDRVNCDPLTRLLTLKMWNTRTFPDNGNGGLTGINGANFSGTGLINWGDGTTEPFNLHTPGSNTKEYNFVHTYPSPISDYTDYIITISYTFTTETQTIFNLNILDETSTRVVNLACGKGEILPPKEHHQL